MSLEDDRCEWDAAGGPEAPELRFDRSAPMSVRSLLGMMQTERGLKRLRFIENRDYARLLYDLYWIAERNDADPKFRAREQTKAEERQREDDAWIASIAERALAGELGKDWGGTQELQRLAQEMLFDEYKRQRTDMPSLRAFQKAARAARLRKERL